MDQVEKEKDSFERLMLEQIKGLKDKIDRAVDQIRKETQQKLDTIDKNTKEDSTKTTTSSSSSNTFDQRQQITLNQVESITDFKVHERFERIKEELEMELQVMSKKIQDQSNLLDRRILEAIASPIDSLRQQLSSDLEKLSFDVDHKLETFHPADLSETQLKLVREEIESLLKQKGDEKKENEHLRVQIIVEKILKKYQIDLWSSSKPPPDPSVSIKDLSHFRNLLLDEVQQLLQSQFYNDGIDETDFALSSLGASIEDYSTRRSLSSLFSSHRSDPSIILDV